MKSSGAKLLFVCVVASLIVAFIAPVKAVNDESLVLFMPFDELEPTIETIQNIQRREIGLECFALNDFDMAVFLLRETSSDTKKLGSGEYIGIDGATPWSAQNQLPPKER